MIKAVIFDLDGTLTNFNIDYRSVRADVRSSLIRAGVPVSVLSINESIFEMLKKAKIFMKNSGKSEKEFIELRSKALGIAEKYELEAAKTTSLLPGVLETLKALKEKNLKLGLCTVNGEKSTSYILKRFVITEFFDAVISRNNVKNVKPHTEHLEATLNALKVSQKEVVVVGDSVIDMKCARELGAIAVAIPTGTANPKELVDSGANYLITAITDLPTLIEYINRS
ncbi:MAG: HAD family hydrolase [Candidatus Bathyarchaeia archaeon]